MHQFMQDTEENVACYEDGLLMITATLTTALLGSGSVGVTPHDGDDGADVRRELLWLIDQEN